MMRRKPAACSKVLVAQARHLQQGLARLEGAVLVAEGDDVLRPASGSGPDTRASSAADAVFTSTPTAFTQSSTTASSARARRDWSTSCWYWPTPIALGSILTSSASGSCRRRAIDTAPRSVTSRSGNSLRRQLGRRIDRRAGLRHHDLGQLELRACLRSARRRACRFRAMAVPLPMAIEIDLVLHAQCVQDRERPVPLAPGFVRIDRRRFDDLAGAIDHGDLDAGAEARDRDRSRPSVRRARPAADP